MNTNDKLQGVDAKLERQSCHQRHWKDSHVTNDTGAPLTAQLDPPNSMLVAWKMQHPVVPIRLESPNTKKAFGESFDPCERAGNNNFWRLKLQLAVTARISL